MNRSSVDYRNILQEDLQIVSQSQMFSILEKEKTVDEVVQTDKKVSFFPLMLLKYFSALFHYSRITFGNIFSSFLT